MIDVRDLSFSYGSRPVLRDIRFHVEEGEFVSLLGANGAGKSTLFRCILGLLRGYAGTALLHGEDTAKLSPRQMARLAAYIPQTASPTYNYSVEDIVLMGAAARLGPLRSPGARDRERVEWALEKIGIEHLRRRCFHHISGGERQLVILARALVQDAKILLLDEPTASLDYGNQILVLSQVRQLSREGYTILQTTHSPEHAYLFSDRILALQDGRILRQGAPAEILTPEVMGALYGIDVEISSLFSDRVRVCTPGVLVKEP